MFRETLTANDKYLFLDCVNLANRIQMQLSLKPTIFSDFLFSFQESTINYKHFQKKDGRHSYFISEITDCERVG